MSDVYQCQKCFKFWTDFDIKYISGSFSPLCPECMTNDIEIVPPSNLLHLYSKVTERLNDHEERITELENKIEELRSEVWPLIIKNTTFG